MFGAIAELNRESSLSISWNIGRRIKDFLERASDETLTDRATDSLSKYEQDALSYYDAVKYSFTDAGARKTRISVMKSVIEGSIGLQ